MAGGDDDGGDDYDMVVIIAKMVKVVKGMVMI
jgi:hypothetical protein